MRLIPKKSKVNATVWKSLTLFDLCLILILGVIAFVIVMSNFEYKWALLLAFVSISIMLFFPNGDEKAYNDLIYIIRFWASRKNYQKGAKHKDAADLIPFRKIAEDGVIEYEKYVGAVVSVGSVEFGLFDEFEQNRRISKVAEILNGLGDKSVVQLVKIDRPINYDEVAKRLYDKLEIARGEFPQDTAKIAILESRLAQIDGMNNLEKQYRPFYYVVLYEEQRDVLFQQVDFARSKLDEAGLESNMLEAHDVAVFFKYCYTRNFDERDVEDVKIEDFTDYIKPEKIRFTSSACYLDDVYSFTYAIDDYPLVVGNAWGANLFNLDNTKVVLTIKSVEKSKAVKRIDRAVVELESRRGSGKISEAITQETHVQTMADLAKRLQNGNELLFDCTLTVTGFNNTKQKNSDFRKELRRKITADGFHVNILRGRQFDGFASATVSQYTHLKSLERGINSESLASVFPFVFSSIIEPDGLTLGYDYYPVVLDVWKRDQQQYINSNMIVLGKSGSGKSFFAKTLISLIYSENSRVFILDPENEYITLCRNIGGQFIDVGSATEGHINPLHIYQILTDDGTPAAPEIVFSAHLQFLESFFQITLRGISSDSLEELNNLIAEVYKIRGIDPSTDVSNYAPEDFPNFDDLMSVVKNCIKKEIHANRKENLERVKTYVAKFATGGRYATLWNGASTLTSRERLIVFNFQSLLSSKNVVVSNAQMLLVMRYLDQQIINIRELNRNRENPIHPFVVIDEGYNFVDPEYPVALDFVFLWYKRIRKYEGSVSFLTQNLSDILGNPSVMQKTTAIINNAQYSFIFTLAPADLEILIDLYKNAGAINDTEQNQITNAGNGQCFAICSSKSRASFRVVASDAVYTLFQYPNAVEMIENGLTKSPYEK